MTGRENPYFELQAAVGITEHVGGLGATVELLDACDVGEGDLVLDVGCGTGITACYAARTCGCHVVGLDRSDRMVAWASKRARDEGVDDAVEFVVGDVDALPFGDERFDVVLSESVTAFARDGTRAVANYARVTRPGGHVGLNEVTWLRDPPDELRAYVSRTVGAAFETPGGWADRLAAAGLDDVQATPHEVSPSRQYVDELRRQGAAGIATAWWRAVASLFTDPDFRRTVWEFWPRGWAEWRALLDAFEYYGYGLYVGVKDAETGCGSR